ncbi:MAG: hypothetical protein AB8B85_21705 [Paracoccaceae bacterium]
MRLAIVVVAASAFLSACAVKGYDLGWRVEDRLTPLLGTPLDVLSGCRLARDDAVPAGACAAFVRDVQVLLSNSGGRPEAIGARCGAATCTYANAYDRRDVGIAAVLPVYKRVALREVRMQFAFSEGEFVLQTLSVRDNAPPTYGPVRIGGSP